LGHNVKCVAWSRRYSMMSQCRKRRWVTWKAQTPWSSIHSSGDGILLSAFAYSWSALNFLHKNRAKCL